MGVFASTLGFYPVRSSLSQLDLCKPQPKSSHCFQHQQNHTLLSTEFSGVYPIPPRIVYSLYSVQTTLHGSQAHSVPIQTYESTCSYNTVSVTEPPTNHLHTDKLQNCGWCYLEPSSDSIPRLEKTPSTTTFLFLPLNPRRSACFAAYINFYSLTCLHRFIHRGSSSPNCLIFLFFLFVLQVCCRLLGPVYFSPVSIISCAGCAGC